MAEQPTRPIFKLSSYAPPVPTRKRMGVFEWLVLGCCALGALASPALIIWATVIADESVGAARGVLFRLGLLGMLIATPAAIAAFGILLKTFRTSPPPPDQ